MSDEKAKRVFKYFNGAEEVYGDPLRIQRELYLILGDPDTAFETAYKDAGKENAKFDPESIRAQNCIIDNAREAFKMVPYDPKTGEGATDEMVEEALDALWEYMEKKSKNTGMKPSSEPSTTPIPAPCPTKPS